LDADVAEKWKADEKGAKAIGRFFFYNNYSYTYIYILARDWTQKYAHEN
jgi:hypothetical protein